ncbi:hypothetical protein GI374_12130 [Paracoccus sp. S-4012]|uniref:baseplate J/gp47 family protein n=1 Tax=Paracoccus sp. S-4012 TaxID=2665648 RepID=UPI0012AFB27B|nr:baseplate J/gp47 family protein [Paracoccus sp. S-4012]MRX51183.1 hypothetical protein [Paracoccus sp. S-4012]
MSFRRRDYPEVLETMLTSLVGGVAAEAHPWPPAGEAERTVLEAPPARLLVSVHGARNGLSHRFQLGADVELAGSGTELVWRPGGARPDDGSLIEVNYLRRESPALLTDFEVGGVARTLVEAMAHEAARVHAALEGVYNAAFIETASGRALDHVVALVGVERVPAGRARASLRFTRDAASTGAITIPAGTRVIDPEVEVEYETVETVTMSPAQTRVSVEAQDVEPGNPPVADDLLTILPVPIAGIAAVTNPAPGRRADTAESDAELRTRARSFLQGSERGTVGALQAALARQGVRGEISEPADRPGVVVITPVTEALTPERREQLLKAIEDARPAGVRVELAGAAAPVGLTLSLTVATAPGLDDKARRAAHEAVRAAVAEIFAALPTREDARINQIVGAVLAVQGVEDVTLLSARLLLEAGPEERLDAAAGVIALQGVAVTLAELSLADPGLPTRADLRVRFPAAEAAPDQNGVTAALEAAFAHLSAAGDAEGRTLSYGKLLLVLPPPVGAGGTLALFIAQANGLTRVLANPGDSYALSPGERLALQSVTIEAEG